MAKHGLWSWVKRGGEALSEEAFTSGLMSIFKMAVDRPEVKDRVKSMFNDFLPNDTADEQLFNAAISHENVDINDLHILLQRVSRLSDHQQNRFRILVAQYTMDKDRKAGDPEKTAKVLVKLSKMGEDDWKYYVRFMDLNKKRTDKQVSAFFRKNGKSFAVWARENQIAMTSWAENTGSPALRQMADELRESRERGYAWDPKVTNRTFWGRIKAILNIN